MKKVYITCNWGDNGKTLLDGYKKQSPLGDGVWNDIRLVETQQEADFVLAMDGISEQILKSKKLIFFGREPGHVKLNMMNKEQCFGVYHHEIQNSWLAATWWVGKSYSELKQMTVSPAKTNDLSVIDSGKSVIAGHRNRLSVINKLIQKYPGAVDIFGHITDGKAGVPYKYSLPHKQKDEGLMSYRYNLVIENGSTDYYFSEKFIDPILCWTMPIYWGCKKIHKFFPKGSYVSIDIDDPNAVDKIIEISKSDFREQHLEALGEARQLILNKYNLFPTLEMAIEGRLNLKDIIS